MPASPRQNAHGHSQRSVDRVVARLVAVGPDDLEACRRPGRRGSSQRSWRRSPIDRTPFVRSRGRCAPGNTGRLAGRVWPKAGYPPRGEPRDRPRHEALRHDRRPGRARLRGRAGRGLRLPRRERRRQDDDDADLPRDRPRRRRRDPLGRPADRASCRGERGATCPRSAASTRGWASSTSSSTTGRCTGWLPTSRGARRSPG